MKTTTREFDEHGNLAKETIVEQADPVPYVNTTCNCASNAFGQWYCPTHGFVNRAAPAFPNYPYPTTLPYITCQTGNTTGASNLILFNRSAHRDDDPPQLAHVG